MNSQADFIATEGLGFQGRITASVSHEINNVLATISETAGLLVDLTELAESGRPFDAAELRGCARDIVDEVKRGFRVVKNLNTFAHSADEAVAEVDLGQLVVLVTGLAGYVSFSSSVDLECISGAGPRLTTRPLLLENLVYRALIHAFKQVGPDGSIAVSTGSTPDGGRIVISGLGRAGADGFLGDEVTRIARALDGRVETNAGRDELHFLLPSLIENGSVGEAAAETGR
jgi:C4-dicarboxylate-specific signal transduction histidine kinase